MEIILLCSFQIEKYGRFYIPIYIKTFGSSKKFFSEKIPDWIILINRIDYNILNKYTTFKSTLIIIEKNYFNEKVYLKNKNISK